MKWKLSTAAKKDLRKLDPPIAKLILDTLETTPFRKGSADVKKLRGHKNRYRLRIGDWRVIFRHDNERNALVVLVLCIRHRRGAYRDS